MMIFLLRWLMLASMMPATVSAELYGELLKGIDKVGVMVAINNDDDALYDRVGTPEFFRSQLVGEMRTNGVPVLHPGVTFWSALTDSSWQTVQVFCEVTLVELHDDRGKTGSWVFGVSMRVLDWVQLNRMGSDGKPLNEGALAGIWSDYGYWVRPSLTSAKSKISEVLSDFADQFVASFLQGNPD